MPELLELPVPGKWQTVLSDSDIAVELASSLKNQRRPAAIHAYGTGSSRRYLLSWVKNSGADFQDWGWTKGLSPDELSQEVDGADDRLRLFLVEPIPGVNKLAAVWFIRDTTSSAPCPSERVRIDSIGTSPRTQLSDIFERHLIARGIVWRLILISRTSRG